MLYDPDTIWHHYRPEWMQENGHNMTLLDYIPQRSRNRNDVTRFIIAMKEGKTDALELAYELLADAIASHEEYLKREARCRYIVSIPSHQKNRPNQACETLCSRLEQDFTWLTHLPGALQRIATVPKAAFAAPGRRPTYEDHLRTIRYVGLPRNLRGKGVIMLDDVYTRGDTSNACRAILKESARPKLVIGIFIGRTVWA